MKSPPKFKVGDPVIWASQSNGVKRLKQGKVLVVVPPNGRPDSHIPKGFNCNSSAGYGMYRGDESYLIQVGKSTRLYWPRVKHLCMDKTAEPVLPLMPTKTIKGQNGRTVRTMTPYSKAWEREANELAREAMPVAPCSACGHPTLQAYCCTICGSTDP